MILKTFIGAAALALVANSAVAEGKLSVYHWFEYIPAELVQKFEKKYDVAVTIDTFDSNESMLASLKAGTMGSYDVAVPGDYMVEINKVCGLDVDDDLDFMFVEHMIQAGSAFLNKYL